MELGLDNIVLGRHFIKKINKLYLVSLESHLQNKGPLKHTEARIVKDRLYSRVPGHFPRALSCYALKDTATEQLEAIFFSGKLPQSTGKCCTSN